MKPSSSSVLALSVVVCSSATVLVEYLEAAAEMNADCTKSTLQREPIIYLSGTKRRRRKPSQHQGASSDVAWSDIFMVHPFDRYDEIAKCQSHKHFSRVSDSDVLDVIGVSILLATLLFLQLKLC